MILLILNCMQGTNKTKKAIAGSVSKEGHKNFEDQINGLVSEKKFNKIKKWIESGEGDMDNIAKSIHSYDCIGLAVGLLLKDSGKYKKDALDRLFKVFNVMEFNGVRLTDEPVRKTVVRAIANDLLSSLNKSSSLATNYIYYIINNNIRYLDCQSPFEGYILLQLIHLMIVECIKEGIKEYKDIKEKIIGKIAKGFMGDEEYIKFIKKNLLKFYFTQQNLFNKDVDNLEGMDLLSERKVEKLIFAGETICNIPEYLEGALKIIVLAEKNTKLSAENKIDGQKFKIILTKIMEKRSLSNDDKKLVEGLEKKISFSGSEELFAIILNDDNKSVEVVEEKMSFDGSNESF